MKFRVLCMQGFAALTLVSAALAATASPLKTLHVLLTKQESVMDPAVASDIATASINENIFEPMLTYEYLARPVKLKANTLTAIPTISDGGKTYTMHLQHGILFTPDPAFHGQPRELVAEDYVYSIKRLYDPGLKSPWLFMFEGKLLGDDKLRADKLLAGKKFDIRTPIAGIQAVDKYTLRIRLNAPDTNFLFILATTASGAVAKEVIEAYGNQAGNHPVGTGPFMLSEWQRSFQIVLSKNPQYRTTVFDEAAGNDPVSQSVAASLKGKSEPLVDKVEITIVEENQARILGFLNRQFDVLEQVPAPLAEMVLKDGKLKPELQQQGIRLNMFPTLQTYYMWMNMDDPVIGGYTPEKIALRRAIALSYNSKEDISLIEKGLAIQAQTPLPPSVLGYDANFVSPVQYDIQLANALLDKFGYQRGADGYRTLPDGKPLQLLMHSEANAAGRLREEVWRKNMDALGIRIQFKTDKHSEIIHAARLGKVQMNELDWIADFPDGENFYQLLYGRNIGRANYARFNLPAFNQLYEQSQTMADSPERRKIYQQMALLLHAYNPWVLRTHPLSADVIQPWLQNYMRHPVNYTNWRYLDIAPDARQNSKR
ncbi:ABC transporter substrate-binding protein [Undibacterium jejuense]|nr:ABC transporter substrate-binding protein [Undibacterium jejuense]